MKSIATTALAALMLLGTVSAIATSKQSASFSDGGPVPLCQPTDPSCPSPMPTVAPKKASKFSDGGPVPLCQPTDPNCPSPMPTVQ